MKALFCDNCIYFDTDKDEQPCCSCGEGVNFKIDGNWGRKVQMRETAKEIIKLAREISAKVKEPIRFTCSGLKETGEESNKM